MKNKIRTALLLSGLVTSTLVHAASPNNTKFDSVFAEIKTQNPGCSVGVIKNGKLIHKNKKNLKLLIVLHRNSIKHN